MIYTIVVDSISDILNKSQYFNPLLSWLVVSFIYYSIGIGSDSIWNNLYEVTNWGFYATLIAVLRFVSKNLGYEYVEFYRYLLWLETYCFGFNEWGYVYINFIKIRSCIKSLRSKTWSFFMYSFLVYTQICRTLIAYFEFNEEKQKAIGEKNIKILSIKSQAILYIPMGIFELIFLYLIIKNIIKEEDQKSINVLNILLHSTLSRMFIVSLIFFSMSVVVWFEKKGIALLINRFLWRMKGSLGVIFSVDLLLLRIELDNTTLKESSEKLNKATLEKSMTSQNNYLFATTGTVSDTNYLPHTSNSSPLIAKKEINFQSQTPINPSNAIGSLRMSTYSTTKNIGEVMPRNSIDFHNSNELLFNSHDTPTNITSINVLFNSDNHLNDALDEYLYNSDTKNNRNK